jgi:hypothetical protein
MGNQQTSANLEKQQEAVVVQPVDENKENEAGVPTPDEMRRMALAGSVKKLTKNIKKSPVQREIERKNSEEQSKAARRRRLATLQFRRSEEFYHDDTSNPSQTRKATLIDEELLPFSVRINPNYDYEAVADSIVDQSMKEMFLNDIKVSFGFSDIYLQRYLTIYGPPRENESCWTPSQDLILVLSSLLNIGPPQCMLLIKGFLKKHEHLTVNEDEEVIIEEIDIPVSEEEVEDDDIIEDPVFRRNEQIQMFSQRVENEPISDEVSPDAPFSNEVFQNNSPSNEIPSNEIPQHRQLKQLIHIKKRVKINYTNQEDVYQPILERFILFDEGEICSIAKISEETGVPRSTLYSWRKHIKTDSGWIPNHHQCSANRRIFSSEQEKVIANYLRSEFISQHRILTIGSAKPIILEFHKKFEDEYRQFLADGEVISTIPPYRPLPKFSCSNSFMRRFLHRQHLSVRKARPVKRKEVDPEDIDRFKRELIVAFQTAPKTHIINCDETRWNVCQPYEKTIAETGADSVTVTVNGDLKLGFTLLGAISAAGEKFPLVFLAKGTTDKCHKQYNLPATMSDQVYHTPSGWMKDYIFIQYLDKLRSYRQEGTIHLVVDNANVHITDRIMKRAEELNIKFIMVPVGGTGQYQPLDRVVFGIFKSIGRAKWNRIDYQTRIEIHNKDSGAALALESWDEVTQHHVLLAWVFKDIPETALDETTSDSDFEPLMTEPSSTINEENQTEN